MSMLLTCVDHMISLLYTHRCAQGHTYPHTHLHLLLCSLCPLGMLGRIHSLLSIGDTHTRVHAPQIWHDHWPRGSTHPPHTHTDINPTHHRYVTVQAISNRTWWEVSRSGNYIISTRWSNVLDITNEPHTAPNEYELCTPPHYATKSR